MNIRELLFRMKYQVYRPGTFNQYRQILESQYWTRRQWEQYHAKKKAAIVAHAYKNIPFYNRLYSHAGITEKDLADDNIFQNLPILRKEDIKNHFEDLLFNTERNQLGVSTTGGSTGIPVKCGYNKALRTEIYAWRTLSWWGISPSDDGAYVWRDRRSKLTSKLVNQLAWWPTSKLRLDASGLTHDSISRFLRKFNASKPPQLQGYVGAINELANFILDHKIETHSPRAVWVTAAPLTKTQEKRIERAFNAPVYDQYGCCEIPWIAAQCEQRDKLHINEERLHLEITDTDNATQKLGEWGKILVTRYDDTTFPLIRYELGDRGKFEDKPCRCGRTLKLINKIKGRISEKIVLPSGKTLSGEYLTTIFDSCPEAVKAFKVTQKADERIIVEFVTESPNRISEEFENAKKSLLTKFGNEVPVEFTRVNSIPHDNGKTRFILSEKSMDDNS